MSDELYTERKFLAEINERVGMQHPLYQFALNQTRIIELSGKQNEERLQIIKNNESAYRTMKKLLLDDINQLSMLVAKITDHCDEVMTQELKKEVAEMLMKVCRDS